MESHLNLLGSHDTARILTVAGGDVASVRLAALLTFTFPGAPCIYYGDEIGMTGGPDPGCRAGSPWDHRGNWNNEILEAFSSLTRLRRAWRALRHGSYHIVHAPAGQHLYAFVRESGTERLLIGVCSGDHTAQTVLNSPVTGQPLRRVRGIGEAEARDGEIRVQIPSRQGAIWELI